MDNGPLTMTVDLGIDGIGEAYRIGEGGFGIVYRARQESLGRDVAVKVLRTHGADLQARQRFEHECQALGRVSNHPHVGAIYASGVTTDGRLYLVMEYLSGGSLADRLRHNGPLPWLEVRDIGVRIASALAAAHSEDVLHRDVKPENILLSGYGQPKLVDFGIARLHGGASTRSGVSSGTLAHAAPEVVSGEPADEASDVYSLGSTLHALLAGEAPFVRQGEETLHALVARIFTDDPPDLQAHGVPAEMSRVLRSALAKQRGDRTPTAVTLGAALAALGPADGGGQTEPPPPRHSMTVDIPRQPRPASCPADATRSRTRRRWAVTTACCTALAAVVVAASLAAGGAGVANKTIASGRSSGSTTSLGAATSLPADVPTSLAASPPLANAPVGDTPTTQGRSVGSQDAPSGAGSGLTSHPGPSGDGDTAQPAAPSSPLVPVEPPAGAAPSPPVLPVRPGPTSTTPATGPSGDAHPCSAAQQTQFGHKVQYCPLWRDNVPVYDSPDKGGNARQVGTLVVGGSANWFVGQSQRSRYTFGAYTNQWWAFTMADNDVWGWVPEVYFKGGANDEKDGGLHVCNTRGNVCAP